MQLDGKVAIVTGACSGLGRAIASRFAAQGACVVVADVNEAAIPATVNELKGLAGDAIGFAIDVTERDKVQEMMDRIVAQRGRIDILVNNAGITRYRPFATIADVDWDPVLALDLKAVFYCAQTAAPHMVRQRYGKIVNISSSLGTGSSPHHTAGSPGGSSAYASAKAAVIQLTKTLARELGPSGINVNCVAPGFFLTPLHASTRTPEQIKEHIEVRKQAAVLNRAGKPEELADAVLFLASDQSSFITGQTLCVDGGRTDRM
ncbi:MAG: glucose 1-dehydrogenase [Mesorhizobium sp.]|nr:MAG: glucose 1-dehydrogenase [Mesorhizobium sp.]